MPPSALASQPSQAQHNQKLVTVGLLVVGGSGAGIAYWCWLAQVAGLYKQQFSLTVAALTVLPCCSRLRSAGRGAGTVRASVGEPLSCPPERVPAP